MDGAASLNYYQYSSEKDFDNKYYERDGRYGDMDDRESVDSDGFIDNVEQNEESDDCMANM